MSLVNDQAMWRGSTNTKEPRRSSRPPYPLLAHPTPPPTKLVWLFIAPEKYATNQ